MNWERSSPGTGVSLARARLRFWLAAIKEDREESIAPFPGSPPALGPYSLGVMAEGKFLFVSGMTPFDPVAGRSIVASISRQTELVLENIKNVLGAGGASLANVVSCRVYLSNLTAETFREMNEVYAALFRRIQTRPGDRRSSALGFRCRNRVRGGACLKKR